MSSVFTPMRRQLLDEVYVRNELNLLGMESTPPPPPPPPVIVEEPPTWEYYWNFLLINIHKEFVDTE